jgi:cytochrome P450
VRVEPFLHRKKLSLFLDTLEAAATGKEDCVVDFFLAFRCLTADTIMDYCFQADLNALASERFQNRTVEAFIAGFDLALVATYFPNLFGALNALIFSLPESVRASYFAPVYGFQVMQRLAMERVDHLMQNPESEQGAKKLPTMFDAMLAPDRSKGQVTPSKHDMIADGCLMIAAGTDTTANTLGIVLWHVTQNAEIEKKLVEELKKGIEGRDQVVGSEKLEGGEFVYLRAVVKEALRLAYGVPGAIMRRVPSEGAKFGDVFVPGGVSLDFLSRSVISGLKFTDRY